MCRSRVQAACAHRTRVVIIVTEVRVQVFEVHVHWELLPDVESLLLVPSRRKIANEERTANVVPLELLDEERPQLTDRRWVEG